MRILNNCAKCGLYRVCTWDFVLNGFLCGTCMRKEMETREKDHMSATTGEDFWMDELEFQLGKPLTPTGRDHLRSWLRAFAAHVKRQSVNTGATPSDQGATASAQESSSSPPARPETPQSAGIDLASRLRSGHWMSIEEALERLRDIRESYRDSAEDGSPEWTFDLVPEDAAHRVTEFDQDAKFATALDLVALDLAIATLGTPPAAPASDVEGYGNARCLCGHLSSRHNVYSRDGNDDCADCGCEAFGVPREAASSAPASSQLDLVRAAFVEGYVTAVKDSGVQGTLLAWENSGTKQSASSAIPETPQG